MQYYLELDPEIADAYFESSTFAEASEQLEEIAKQLGIVNHFELFSYAAQNDLCPAEYQETEIPWHEPQVGVDWLDAVSTYIRSNPASVPNAERLLSDFAECKDVLQRAKAEGSKWHFAMDI
jgi:hypothetical protein